MTGDEIRELRMSLHVTQEKFAALLGTTVVTINRWENEKAKPSRLYLRELKELKRNHGSYACRRKEYEKS